KLEVIRFVESIGDVHVSTIRVRCSQPMPYRKGKPWERIIPMEEQPAGRIGNKAELVRSRRAILVVLRRKKSAREEIRDARSIARKRIVQARIRLRKVEPRPVPIEKRLLDHILQ